MMKTQKFNIRGTEMNKVQFNEIEDYLSAKGIDCNEAFNILADESEYVYVSNGFINGLLASENEPGEWHHFFRKDIKGNFEASKLKFN